MVAEIGGVSHLVIAFPFLLLFALAPRIVGEKQFLFHPCVGHIKQAEARQMGPQTIVGVVAEDEELAVGQSDFLHHIVADERSFKGCADDVGRHGHLLFGNASPIHRRERAREVVFREVVANDASLLPAPRRENRRVVVRAGRFEHALQTGGRWENIVVHTPDEISVERGGMPDSRVETARASHVVLRDDSEVLLRFQPFSRAVGASVVDHNDFSNRPCLVAQSVDGSFQQF